MKNLLLSATALGLALTAGSAYAADLPSRKAPPTYIAPAPVATWTGFYVGLNAGGAFGGGSAQAYGGPVWANPLGGPLAVQVSSALGTVTNANLSGSNGGFLGGGQIGYNYQWGQHFVVGLETDIQGFAGGGGGGSAVTAASYVPAVDTQIGATSVNRSLDYLGTVRGRIGYLVTPTLLLYGTGGLAYGGANLSSTFFSADQVFVPAGALTPAFGGSSYSDTRVGWTAGGGVEWLFSPNWSAKLEYLYYDLGTAVTPASLPTHSAVVAGVPFASAAQQVSSHFYGNIVRVGVNYHFNWGAPAPVLAKY